MNVSPIQLRNYVFTRVLVEPREATDFALPEPNDVPFDWDSVNISSSVEFAWADGQGEDPRTFAIRLELQLKNLEGKPAPYKVDLGCIGYFELVGDLSKVNRLDLAQVNGSSILYGALREYLFATTSRFPNGALVLPSVNFLDLKAHASGQVGAITNEAVSDKNKRSESAST